MQNTKMTGLQFFAESAAAETENGAGVEIAADAGQKGTVRLEDLGVPAEKARSYREFKGITEPNAESEERIPPVSEADIPPFPKGLGSAVVGKGDEDKQAETVEPEGKTSPTASGPPSP